MRTVAELSEKDIKQIIANAFDVDVVYVSLLHSEVWEGYAQNEHKKPIVTAKVTLKGANNANP